MKTKFYAFCLCLLAISIQVFAAEVEVKVTGEKAKTIYSALAQRFPEFDSGSNLGICMAEWSAQALFCNGTTCSATGYNRLNGQEEELRREAASFLRAIAGAHILFNSKKEFESIECTYWKAGLGGCAEDQPRFECNLRLVDLP